MSYGLTNSGKLGFLEISSFLFLGASSLCRSGWTYKDGFCYKLVRVYKFLIFKSIIG